MPGTEKPILPLQRPRSTPGRRRETPERGGGRFVAQTEDSNRCEGCCGGKGLRRCLVLLGLIYFQVSTFALVQWLKEHADVHGGLPLPRMRRTLKPADGSTALALPPTPATLPPSPPPPPAGVSGLAVPSRASEAPSLPSGSLSHSPPPPLPPPRAGEQDEDAVDELPNELPSLDKDLDKEGEAGVGELGEHGGEAGVSEELVGLALPEGEAGVGALGGELGAGCMVKGRRRTELAAGRPLGELAAHGSGRPPVRVHGGPPGSSAELRPLRARTADCCPGAAPRPQHKAGSTASWRLPGR